MPIRVLELVLDVEHPDPSGGRQQEDRSVHRQEPLESDGRPYANGHGDQGRVGPPHALPGHFPALRDIRGIPVLDDELIQGSAQEERQRMPVDPVS
jgi:hypothetical protein